MKSRVKIKSRAFGWRSAFKPLLFSLLVVAVATSCIKERFDGNNDKDGEKTLTLQLKTPYFDQPQTRAIGDAEQATLKDIDVISFRVESDGKEYYEYFAPTSKVGAQHKARVLVKPGVDQRFVVIANAHAKVVEVINAFSGEHPLREDFMKQLTLSLDPDTKWDATSNSVYSPLPMYGESTVMEVTSSTTSMGNISMVRMHSKIEVVLDASLFSSKKFQLRSIHMYNANLKGRVAPIIDDANTYFNRATNIAVTPSLPAAVAANTNPLVYMANPLTEGGAMTGGIFTFEAVSKSDASKQPCIVVGGVFNEEVDGSSNEVVTYYRVDFLDTNKDYLSLLRNHCYTVNVMDVSLRGYETPTLAFEAKPINLDYNVEIWNNGYTGWLYDGAYELGYNKNLFSPTKEGYRLTDSDNTLSISCNHHDWKIEVLDQNKDLATSGFWLNLDDTNLSYSGLSGNKDFKICATTNTGAPRIGYIRITAGRLSVLITVEQSDVTASMLTSIVDNIQQDGMEFAAANGIDPGEKKFKIQWSPRSETLFASVAPVPNPAGGNYDAPIWNYYNTLTGSGALDVNGAAVYVNPVTDPTGEVEFTIKPKPITNGVDGVNLTTNPFYERQIQINYRATGAMGMMRKSFTIQQYVYNMVPKLDGFYLADGSQYSFKVQSNRQWKAYLIDNGGGMVEKAGESNNIDVSTPGSGILIGQGGYNVESGGTKVYFKTINDLANPTLILGTAKVRIEWLKNGNDPAVEANWDKATVVNLQCGSKVEPGSNCYMVKGAGIDILIPTRQVAVAMGLNELPTTQTPTPEKGFLGMGWITTAEYAKLKVDVLWSDIPGASYTNTSVVKALSYDGKHVAGGTITVTPGTGVGNAVICLYIDNEGNNDPTHANNKIKWSWHIWNAGGYYPYDGSGNPVGIGTNNAWMDRNLGATGNSAADGVKALGLMYQWGRKDPYTGATTTTGTAIKPIYNAAGTAITQPSWAAGNTLTNSVQNPLLMVSDWTGSLPSPFSQYSWSNTDDVVDAKTIFDPCPEGYRVPTYENAKSPWDGLSAMTISVGGGATWATHGGYYPTNGQRLTSGLSAVGSYGHVWFALQRKSLRFTNNDITPKDDASTERHMGLRCKKTR